MNEHFGSVEERSFKTPAAVGPAQLGYENPGRKEQRQSRCRSSQEAALFRSRESENGTVAKGSVEEGESREEECLTRPTDLTRSVLRPKPQLPQLRFFFASSRGCLRRDLIHRFRFATITVWIVGSS